MVRGGFAPFGWQKNIVCVNFGVGVIMWLHSFTGFVIVVVVVAVGFPCCCGCRCVIRFDSICVVEMTTGARTVAAFHLMLLENRGQILNTIFS